MLISFNELLLEAKNLEDKEAARLGENNDWEGCNKATELYSQVFECIHTHDTFNNVTYERPLNSWHHRELHEFGVDARTMGIHRERALKYVDEYLSCEWMRCEKMDWFVVNFLIYAEIIAYVNFIVSDKNAAYALPKSFNVRVASFNSLDFLYLFIFSFFAYFAFDYSLGVGVFYVFFVLVVSVIFRTRFANKVERTLKSMLSTYSSVSSINLSWLNLWDEMKRSKSFDVVWDSVVYAIVESRITKK